MKIAKWLEVAEKKLSSAGVSTPRLDAQLILCHGINCSRVWLLSHPEYKLEKHHTDLLDLTLSLRLQYVPLAYLFKEKEFYGRRFTVNRHVLVPRPESESLVELALQLTSKKLQVIDVGCGSGILGITLALERPDWKITLSDISAEALDTAMNNAAYHRLNDRLSFVKQDLLRGDIKHYDLVVANLPYVPVSMKENKDLQSEPNIALFSGADGLSHYRSLFSLASDNKGPQYIITESLDSQHQNLQQITQEGGYRLTAQQGLAQLFQKD